MALNPVIKFTTLFGLLAVELAVKLTADAGPGLSLMLSAVAFLLSLVFVYRSFYGMRIGSAEGIGASARFAISVSKTTEP